MNEMFIQFGVPKELSMVPMIGVNLCSMIIGLSVQLPFHPILKSPRHVFRYELYIIGQLLNGLDMAFAPALYIFLAEAVPKKYRGFQTFSFAQIYFRIVFNGRECRILYHEYVRGSPRPSS